MRLVNILIASWLIAAFGCSRETPQVVTPQQSPKDEAAQLARAQNAVNQPLAADLQLVAALYGPMPTGVAVSRSGRKFVCFPRWGDSVSISVAEVQGGRAVPYPNEQLNKLNTDNPTGSFVSVQSVVVDDEDRVWIVDTGSINFQPIIPGAPKLVCVDLSTNKVAKIINFRGSPAVLPTTYLNDIRFDLKRGPGGMGFITDSSNSGPNGIIVVDLASGESWRRLSDHPSTIAQANFVPTVEGQPLTSRMPGQPPGYSRIGSDGIAITPDGKRLFYCPLAGRHLYSVSVDALADRSRREDEVAMTVHDLGDKGFASDGLDMDSQTRLYLSDYEHNAIQRRWRDGRMETLVQDPRMIWPDSLSIPGDGYVYFTANQLNRQPRFHEGKDLRQQPYALFRYPLGQSTDARTASFRE